MEPFRLQKSVSLDLDNFFLMGGCTEVDEKLIRETADALVSSGLAAAGYTYLNLGELSLCSLLRLDTYFRR